VIDRLRVSRDAFREAIGTLAMGGLVEIKPYRGFYVRKLFPATKRRTFTSCTNGLNIRS